MDIRVIEVAAPRASSGGSGTGALSHNLTSLLSGAISGVTAAAQHAALTMFAMFALAVLRVIDGWVADGAVWILAQVGAVLTSTTDVDLGSSWFGARLSLMSELAASVMLPMLLCAVIQAVYRQSAGALLKTFLVNLPIALLFTGVAVELVRVGMVVTDAMSARFMAASGVDTRHLLQPLGLLLLGSVPTAPGFVVLLAGGLVAGTAMILWLELVVRAAAITAASLFLPLVLAALVWPSIGHWARRLADTLAALVLSKLVIAAVISLAVGAIEGGLTEQGSAGTKFGDVVVGIALLLLATFSPFVLLRLIPAIEGGAVSHLDATGRRFRQTVVEPPIRNAAGRIHDKHERDVKEKAENAALARVGESGRSEPSQADGKPWASESDVADNEAKLAPISASSSDAGSRDSTSQNGPAQNGAAQIGPAQKGSVQKGPDSETGDAQQGSGNDA
jgi:hypothetical protein